MKNSPTPKEAFTQFFEMEAASGMVLLACALMALLWANSPWAGTYEFFWLVSLGEHSLRHWINDLLMTLFFFRIGLEIKRELLNGELSTAKKASLPFAAAFGGMLAPAAIFLFFTWGTPETRGWGIPMATDIAFALGTLSLTRARVPESLRIFLAALAIVDDLGAIVVIALFYTRSLDWTPLGLGFFLIFLLAVLNRAGVTRLRSYLMCGFALWLALSKAGIHPTIAGVLLAVFLPLETSGLEKLESIIEPWVDFGIMPVFALANAGVTFLSGMAALAWTHPVTLGTVAGLLIGKQVGIGFFSWLATRLGVSSMPSQASWKQFHGTACLGGIGFTMSLFITTLAFDDPLLQAQAKAGILVASLLSGLLGYALLRRAPGRTS